MLGEVTSPFGRLDRCSDQNKRVQEISTDSESKLKQSFRGISSGALGTGTLGPSGCFLPEVVARLIRKKRKCTFDRGVLLRDPGRRFPW